MADELSNFLLDGTRHAPLSAEALELMGKQAANRLLNEGLPLNETISKLAAAHADINGEQVKRVAEFANNAVYLAKHDQSKVAGADSSYPQFDVADPFRIMQNLSGGSRPTVVTSVDAEYSRMPERSKTASVESDDIIEQAFKVDMSKQIPSFSKESAVAQVYEAKDSLVGLRSGLETHAENFTMTLKEAQAEFYDLVKRHMLNDGSFTDVVVAAQSSGTDKAKIAEGLRPVIERLLVEKVATPSKLSVRDSLEKVAHRVVNEEHPLVVAFRSILSLDAELEKVAISLEEVDAQLVRVNDFIKEKFLVGNSHSTH